MDYFSTYDFAITFLESYISITKDISIFHLRIICKVWNKILSEVKFRQKIANRISKRYADQTQSKIYIPLPISPKNIFWVIYQASWIQGLMPSKKRMLLNWYNIFPCINILFDYGKVVKISNRNKSKCLIEYHGYCLSIYFGKLGESGSISLEASAYGCFHDKELLCVHYKVKDCRGITLIEYSFLPDMTTESLVPMAIHVENCTYTCVNNRWYIGKIKLPDISSNIRQENIDIDLDLFCYWFGLIDPNIIGYKRDPQL